MNQILRSILLKSEIKKLFYQQLWKMNNENKQLKKEYRRMKVISPLTKQLKKKYLNIARIQMKLYKRLNKLKGERNKLNHKQKQNVRNANDWNEKMKNL